jgi:hypothetical protein
MPGVAWPELAGLALEALGICGYVARAQVYMCTSGHVLL